MPGTSISISWTTLTLALTRLACLPRELQCSVDDTVILMIRLETNQAYLKMYPANIHQIFSIGRNMIADAGFF